MAEHMYRLIASQFIKVTNYYSGMLYIINRIWQYLSQNAYGIDSNR